MLRATIARVALLSFLLGFTKYSTAEDKSKPAPIGSKADRTLLAVTTAEWGNLTGRFVYDPDAPKPECGDVKRSLGIIGGYQVVVVKDESLVVSDNGGVANVLIYVISQSIPTHPSYQATNSDKVLLDVQPWRFVPHVTTCRLSQAVILRNSTVHSQNFRIEPPGDMLINPLAPPECSIEHKFTVPQSTPVPVHNDIVPWMAHICFPLIIPMSRCRKRTAASAYRTCRSGIGSSKCGTKPPVSLTLSLGPKVASRRRSNPVRII